MSPPALLIKIGLVHDDLIVAVTSNFHRRRICQLPILGNHHDHNINWKIVLLLSYIHQLVFSSMYFFFRNIAFQE